MEDCCGDSDSFSACCWDPISLLSSSFVLLLLICFVRKILHGHSLQRSQLQQPAEPCSKTQQAPRKSEGGRPHVKAEKREGAKGEALGRSPGAVSQRTSRDSIRKLLCDDVACAVCERTAAEAEKLAFPRGLGLRCQATPAPPFLCPFCPEPPSLPEISELPAQPPLPRSASAPRPACGHSRLNPGEPPPSGERDRRLRHPGSGFPRKRRTEKKKQAAWKEDEEDHSSSAYSPREECCCRRCRCHSSCSSGDGAGQSGSLPSSSSLTASFSHASSSSQSQSSLGSWEEAGHPQQALLLLQEICKCTLQFESEVSSQSGGDLEEEAFPRKRAHRGARPGRRRGGPRGRSRKAAKSPAASPSQRTEPAVDIPFLGEAVRAGLEWHLLRKRVQHTLGLPRALRRSLGAFLPPAPEAAPCKPVRSGAAVARPQALPFPGPEASRRRLEQHLTEMVHLRRWGLPRRVQEAVRHTRPGARPDAGGPSAAVQEEGTGPARPGETCQQAEGRIFRSTCLSEPSLSPSAEPPQETAASKARQEPDGGRLQQADRLGPRREAGAEEELLRDRPHFQVALRTQAWAQVIPGASQLAPWMRPTAPAFMAPTQLECLESHALGKRLQHLWGLPGLIQRSWQQFRRAAPQPAACRALTRPVRPEEETRTVISQLSFVRLEIREQLDRHISCLAVERRWGLPRRATASLRVFRPIRPPSTEKPKERERVLLPAKERRPRGEKPPSGRPATPTKGPADSPGTPWDSKHYIVQRHLAKKALEIQLDLFSPVVRHSQEISCRAGRCSLPKVLPPGLRTVRLRSEALLFVEQAGRHRVELNITHKTLTYRWGLPTLYRTSLTLFSQEAPPLAPGPSPPAPNPPTGRFTAIETLFVAKQTGFLATQTQAMLEWHIKKKQLQHLWGLPGLVQSSLRHLLPTAPRLCHQRPGHSDVAVSQDESLFLGREAKQKLELHVRKRVIFQRWGLPRMALESLRLLCPEMGLCPPGRTEPRSQLAQPKRGFPRERPRGGFLGASGVSDGSQTRKTRAQLPPILEPQDSKKIRCHLVKKSLEAHLGALPPLVGRSRRLATLSTGRPLPRLIPPGQGALRPRSRCLPFAHPEDVRQVELAICRSRLASLWGLGVRYVEALLATGPQRSAPALRTGRRGAEFSGVSTPFLPQGVRDVLELHIGKKRLQHEWGFPARIQGSLRSFMPGALARPALLKAGTQVSVLQQEPAFLSSAECSHLEIHVQKMKLQKHWGLPGRVLESLKQMRSGPGSPVLGQEAERPSFAPEGSCRSLPAEPSPGGLVSTGPSGGSRTDVHLLGAASPPPVSLAVEPSHLKKVKIHLAKKCVEQQLGTFPVLVKLSRRCTSLALRQPLPKLIPPGHRLPRPRSRLLHFERTEDVHRVELCVQRKRLTFLWGLSTRHVETLGQMAPRLPLRPLRRRTAATFAFSEGKVPFLPAQEKDILEEHMRKKRLQHTWGSPALVQRSLRAFVLRPPSAPTCQKTTAAVCVQRLELSFFSLSTCRSLELHVQKMKLQQLWGLPGRVLKALNVFVPSGHLGKDSRRTQRSPPAPIPETFPATGAPAFAAEMHDQVQLDADVQPGATQEGLQQEKPHEGGRQAPKGGTSSGKEGSSECSVSLASSHGQEQERPAERVKAANLVAKSSVTMPPEKGSPTLLCGDVPSLRRRQPQSEGRGERGRPPQPPIVGEGTRSAKVVDQKVVLIGSILEKKLNLQEGLQAWLRHQQSLQERDGRQGCRRAGPDEGLQHAKETRAQPPRDAKCAAREGVAVRREETQLGCSFAFQAGEGESKAQDTEQREKAQLFRAGRREAQVRLGGSSAGSVSSTSFRASLQGTGSLLVLGRARSRERSGARDTGPTIKVGIQISQGMLAGSREQRASRKGHGASSKGGSSKERRSRSKERKSSSPRSGREERKSGRKEQKSSGKEEGSKIREWIFGSRKKKLENKPQSSSSRPGRPGSGAQSSSSSRSRQAAGRFVTRSSNAGGPDSRNGDPVARKERSEQNYLSLV